MSIPSRPGSLTPAERIGLAAILGSGALLRIAIFVAVPQAVRGDGLQYYRIVENLLAGHGFSHSPVAPYYPDGLRTPVYAAALLLPFVVPGPRLLYVFMLQCLMDLSTVCVTFCLARRGWGSRTALLAAALYALAPFPAAYTPQLLAETLSVLIVALVLFAWQRVEEFPARGPCIQMGVWSALGGLCRAPMLAVSLVGLAVVGWRHRLHPSIRLACGTTLILLLPWTVRNFETFGKPVPYPLASFGISLWAGVVQDRPLTSGAPGQALCDEWATQWSPDRDVPPDRIMELDRQLASVAFGLISHDPGGWLRNVAAQALDLWWNPGPAMQSPVRGRLAQADACNTWGEAGQRFLVLAALAGLFRHRRHASDLALLLLPMGVLTAVYAPLHVEGRYMLPAEPALCILAALAFSPGDPDGTASTLPDGRGPSPA